MKTKVMVLSSERARWFLVSKFNCVKRGSWAPWVASWARYVES